MTTTNKADRYVVPLVDGAYEKQTGLTGLNSNHCLGFSVRGSLTTGTVTIKAKSPGSDVFESIPDGVVDLANIHTVLFIFPVAAYQITLSDLSGEAVDGQLTVTDSIMEL